MELSGIDKMELTRCLGHIDFNSTDDVSISILIIGDGWIVSLLLPEGEQIPHRLSFTKCMSIYSCLSCIWSIVTV